MLSRSQQAEKEKELCAQKKENLMHLAVAGSEFVYNDGDSAVENEDSSLEKLMILGRAGKLEASAMRSLEGLQVSRYC